VEPVAAKKKGNERNSGRETGEEEVSPPVTTAGKKQVVYMVKANENT
jgi:hypothetical protein